MEMIPRRDSAAKIITVVMGLVMENLDKLIF